ncbi:Calcium/calmodulin-dependent protein kinase type 1D [Babesia sp. Xinjiang]|uniref:Calcium/calmodulin-dependent protein kinase type 1D n=1 Tax=Babesia sp. Xinjiang TaxID=462227 RepID=UPI000A23C5D3|nr:Calcium/calmodulin-dependent protein kinase type 1D [Babesia sp. Xinjiang]ORM41481.1 Calcium/calmodulin-dependent protein kinase type 1D [Babesia sp. Xinjiang]
MVVQSIGKMDNTTHCNDSVEAFKTLVMLKKELITALNNEWSYAIRECDAISEFNETGSNNGTEPRTYGESSIQTDIPTMDTGSRRVSLETGRDTEQYEPLLRWESPELQALEQRWNNQLKHCIECVKNDATQSKHHSVSIDEVEAIRQSIEQLKNTYMQVVEEREKNNKLWLRLRMYSHARRDMIEKVCKPYGTNKKAVEPMQRRATSNRSSREQTTYRTVKTLNTVDVPENCAPKYVQRGNFQGSNSGSSEELSIDNYKQRGYNMHSDKHSISCSPSVEEFINQTNSTDKFFVAATHIYSQYGDGRMTLKMFNNLVDYLLHSLGIPVIDRSAIKKMFELYGIVPGTLITRDVFVLMYWEVVHIVRRAIDIMQAVNVPGLHVHVEGPSARDMSTFVDINDIFEFKKKLYSGYSCNKFLAVEQSTGELRVVEILHKSDGIPPFEQISLEVSRLSKLQRQHLVLYRDVYHDLNNIYIVSEFCPGGSLLNNLNTRHESNYTIEFIHIVIAQVIEAVLYLHCNNIVHGSLTIDKVMLQETDYNHVKIRDVGLHKLLDTEIRGSTLTTLYSSPESRDGRVSHKSDIWSVGAILAFLVTGVIPEERIAYDEFAAAVDNQLRNSRVFKNDEQLRDLIAKMLSVDPNDRPDAFQLITHPWYTNAGHSDSTPGYFKSMVQPIRRLMALKQVYVDIIRVLESHNALLVCQVPKLINTVQLIKRLKNDNITVKDLIRAIQMEGVSPQITDNLITLLSSGRDDISVDTFMSALIRWKSGEISHAWSEFHRNALDDKISMKSTDFASDKDPVTPGNTGHLRSPYAGQTTCPTNDVTLIAQSPGRTPTIRMGHDEMSTPKKEARPTDSGEIDSLKTPTTRPGSKSLLNRCLSACSSLRFNAESLVSLPYGYCNNTFVKIKADDVFDPRVGRKRARYEHLNHADNTLQNNPPTRKGTRNLANAHELEQLKIHNEYAMNPYKRRYQCALKERRRLERTSSVSTVEEDMTVSPKKIRTQQQIRPFKKREIDLYDNKYSMVADVESRDRPRPFNCISSNTLANDAPAPLNEENRGRIKNLSQVSTNVKSRLLEEMMDVVKLLAAVRQNVQEESETGNGLGTNDAALNDVSKQVRALIQETQHKMIALQYSKMLLNWNITPKNTTGSKHAITSPDQTSAENDSGASQLASRSTESNANQPSGVLVTSPCITFYDGLTCAQGRCSTSMQSFGSKTLTDCYTAAGCYLWEPTSRKRLCRGVAGNVKVHRDGHACDGMDDDMSVTSDIGINRQLGSSRDDKCLGKTGPWTQDLVFAKSILDANRKTQFDAVVEFLKDVCRIAIAEVRIPRPDWKGPSEYACHSGLCCPKCCLCKDGSTSSSKSVRCSGANLTEDNENVRFQMETALAKTDMLATQLGKCVCVCKCVSDRIPIERVVHDNTPRHRNFNDGLVWHNIEPTEHVLEADSPTLPKDAIVQERITLRIKADCVPMAWKKRSPFICRLNIQTEPGDATVDEETTNDTSESSSTGDRVDPPRQNGINLSINVTDDSSNPATEPQGVGVNRNRSRYTEKFEERIPLIQMRDYKELSAFSFWDAADLLYKQQRKLHRALREDNDATDCFDPMEIDTSRIPEETLRLSSDAIVEDMSSEDYLEIALYLPYAPTCTIPWRFETIDLIAMLASRFRPRHQVEVKRHSSVMEDDNEGMELDDNTPHESGEIGGITLGHPDHPSNMTPTVPGYFDESDSSNSYMHTGGDSYTSNAMEEGIATGSSLGTPIETTPDSVEELVMPSDAAICAQLFRDMIVLPSSVTRVQQVIRQHIHTRNKILKDEVRAFKAHRHVWYNNIKRMRASMPRVDVFAWGILPVRAIDSPNEFVPLPAGYKENDISWPYKTNNAVSPFEIDSYGIGDIRKTHQSFSALAHNALAVRRRDETVSSQPHSRKPNAGRRRGTTEQDVVDHNDDDGGRATVWLAPNYSNLTGPGLRWTYSCMDTLSEPMQFIPDFRALPIYRIMKSPDYSYYSMDQCLNYDRRNSLRSEVVIADEITGRVSNVWTRNECRTFVEKYLMYPKNFSKIAQFIETKRCGDCVSFYYRFKYRLKLKERLQDMKARQKHKYEMSRFLKRDMHVMQALDNLLDDCYTDSVREVCEQNAILFSTVSDAILSVGGVDTQTPYEVALTEHRDNWSPLEETGNVHLDNLNEGYFVPKKFRCLISRKSLELPLNNKVGNEETILKRGCLVMNGCRNFGEAQQSNAIVSAIKTEHFMSLRPINSRRMAGRSILESILHNRPLPSDDQPAGTALGIVSDSAPNDTDRGATDVSEPEHVDNGDADNARSAEQLPFNEWGRTVRTKDVTTGRGTWYELLSLPIPTERELRLNQLRLQESYSDYHDYDVDHCRYPVMAYDSALKHKERSSENTCKTKTEKELTTSHPIQKTVTARNKCPAAKSSAAPRRAKKPKVAAKVKPEVKEEVHITHHEVLQETPTDWSSEEIAEFVRLYRLYGEDWETLEREMSRYGRTREQIIQYYIARLTNNAIRKRQQQQQQQAPEGDSGNSDTRPPSEWCSPSSSVQKNFGV